MYHYIEIKTLNITLRNAIINTCVVRLFSELPVPARDVISPLKMKFIVFNRLDFPAPICPTSNIFTSGTSISSRGR